MAKKRTRRKFILKTLIVGAIAYAGISLIRPIQFAVRPSRGIGPTAQDLERILHEKGVPERHLEDTIFVKLHEDYFRYRAAECDVGSRIILIPDNDRNRPNLQNRESFADDVCHEIGHNAYPILPKALRDRGEDYTIRLLDTDLRTWEYLSELVKERQTAFKNNDKDRVKSLDNEISTLYSHSLLPASFDNDYQVTIDIKKIKEAFNNEELFATTYGTYLTGSRDEYRTGKRERRISIGMEKPELESLEDERMQIMADIVSKERGKSLPICTLLDSRADFGAIWFRYINPFPSLKRALGSEIRNYSYNRRIDKLCQTYLAKDNFVKSK